MKKILDHLKQNWIRYGFETIVVTVSILGAFALSSWNEDRLQQKEETEILANLKIDLRNTIKEFDYLNRLRQKIVASSYRIFEISSYPSVRYPESELDSLLSTIRISPTYNGQLGSLQLLFSSGKINLIKKSEIKNRLIAWPGLVEDMREGEIDANKIHDRLNYDVLVNYMVMEDLTQGLESISILTEFNLTKAPLNRDVMKADYKGLLEDRVFINYLSQWMLLLQFAQDESQALIDTANEIILLIDEELNE